jgi:hypothetical protein
MKAVQGVQLYDTTLQGLDTLFPAPAGLELTNHQVRVRIPTGGRGGAAPAPVPATFVDGRGAGAPSASTRTWSPPRGTRRWTCSGTHCATAPTQPRDDTARRARPLLPGD